MTELINKNGKRYLSTSVSLPVELVERARIHGINRSAIVQSALKEEIARIEDENKGESGHTSNQHGARTGATSKEGQV